MPPDPDRRVLPEFAASIRSNGGAPQVGVFGLLGSGNLGNDASFEVVLRYLRAEHPHATVDAMCMGPAQLKQRYGITPSLCSPTESTPSTRRASRQSSSRSPEKVSTRSEPRRGPGDTTS